MARRNSLFDFSRSYTINLDWVKIIEMVSGMPFINRPCRLPEIGFFIFNPILSNLFRIWNPLIRQIDAPSQLIFYLPKFLSCLFLGRAFRHGNPPAFAIGIIKIYDIPATPFCNLCHHLPPFIFGSLSS
jgi:hypothetical protein